MRVLVKGCFHHATADISCCTWGVDEAGWLIFRDKVGSVSHVIKTWDSIEVTEDAPISIPDDAIDAMEIKRGFCDI
jgi:hypothetical protein